MRFILLHNSLASFFVKTNYYHLKYVPRCFFTIAIIGLIWKCTKPEDPIVFEKKYIIVGENDSAFVFQIDDTIQTVYGEAEYSLDVNVDNVIDLIFKTHTSWYFGGMMGQYWSTIQAVNNTEILIDTTNEQVIKYIYKQISDSISIKDTIKYDSKEIIPKIIELNTVINNQGHWNTDSILRFCYYKADLINSDPFETQTIVFKGWDDIENGFLAFRIKIAEDTLFGWLSLEIKQKDQIILKNGAYR